MSPSTVERAAATDGKLVESRSRWAPASTVMAVAPMLIQYGGVAWTGSSRTSSSRPRMIDISIR